jgi:hypothetical protein
MIGAMYNVLGLLYNGVMNVITQDDNQGNQILRMIRSEFPEYHPLLAIARLAHHDAAPLGLQLEAHKTIAKYVQPELKSIEVKQPLDTRKRVTVSLFDEAEVIEAELVEPQLEYIDARSELERY